MSGDGRKGFILEERLRAYFWEAGYFVVRGAPFLQGTMEVTDVDLWLYERPAAASRRRLIVDVKNKKKSKAAERIIWTRGLANIIGADGALVASKDSKPESELIAKKSGVKFFGSSALQKIEKSEKLAGIFALTEDQILTDILTVDRNRKTKDWSEAYYHLRASIITDFGISSLNKSLNIFGYFSRQAVEASPRSISAIIAYRLALISASIVTLSVDFLFSDLNFDSYDSRALALRNAIRFGEVGGADDLKSLKAAIGLIGSYAPQGQPLANEVKRLFIADANSIPATIISEIFSKIHISKIFQCARELNFFGYAEVPEIGESNTLEARSIVGALLDFSGVDRKRFSGAVSDAASAVAGDGQSTFDLDPPGQSA